MKYKRRILLLSVMDMMLLLISSLCSLIISNNGLKTEHLSLNTVLSVVGFIVINSISLLLYKSYKTLWRYSGLQELVRVCQSITLSTVIFTIIHGFFFGRMFPVSYYFILLMTSFIAVGGLRIGWMTSKDLTKISTFTRKKALIVGAGEAGTMVAKQLLHSDKNDFYPIGFIDDALDKQRLEILDLPVVGRRTDIPRIVEQYGIKEIIVALPSVPKTDINSIITICKQTPAQIKILPRMQDWILGRVLVKDIRDIDVKDILGRDMIKQPTKGDLAYLENKTVLVTGAGGSIGSELVYQIALFKPKSIILIGHGENSIYTVQMNLQDRYPEIFAQCVIADIQDRSSIEGIFRQYQPSVVFHAAAHKHVPLMEKNVAAAIKNNVFGTKIVAETAAKYGVMRFIFISTDKAVHPVNIMGMTKRLGELTIQSLSRTSSTRFSTVRFGNVLESRGSVIPIFKKQIALGGPVTVTHPDMVRYFMSIPEAVQLVLEAGRLTEGGEIFVLDMGDPVKIVDLARALIRLSGYEPDRDITILYTGFRPGEKISEILFYEDESIIPSKHPHISIAIPKSMDLDPLEKQIQQLEDALLHESENLREVLERILK